MQAENHWEKAKDSINSVSGLWAKFSNLQLNEKFFTNIQKYLLMSRIIFGLLDTRCQVLLSGCWKQELKCLGINYSR